ncbi:MAG TPA: hypothetical protein VG164_05515, partial [Trebonia sp.]|nr:hypothetical protein [Trebonia sp.]
MRMIRGWLCGLALVAAGASLAACSGGPAMPLGRARAYSSFQACLLTGSAGVAASPGREAWAGMEDASASTSAKVSYLAVTGPATKANALTFLGSLLVRKCDVVVAVGAPEQAAAAADAGKFRKVRFLLAGAGQQGPAAAANVTVLSPAHSG